MTLILLVLAALIVVLLLLLARNLRQLLDLVQSQEARIAALEREREQAAAEAAEPSSVFAFRPTEVAPPPSSVSTSSSSTPAVAADAAAMPSSPDAAELQRLEPVADLPLQTSLDDLPLLHEPAAPVGAALDAEVGRLRAQGLGRRAIAERLGVSEAEVELVERLHPPRG